MDGPPRYEIFHDVIGAAVLDWRLQYVAQQRAQAEASRELAAEREEAQTEAQATRRRLRRLLAAGLVVLLIAGALGVLTYLFYREAEQQRLLSDAAAALGENPVESLRKAVEAYRVSDDKEAREAVLTAASLVPRSRVVAGSGSPDDPRVAGMVVTPDQRHVVTYDAQGGIRVIVIGDDGTVQYAPPPSSPTPGSKPTATPSANHKPPATTTPSSSSPRAEHSGSYLNDTDRPCVRWQLAGHDGVPLLVEVVAECLGSVALIFDGTREAQGR